MTNPKQPAATAGSSIKNREEQLLESLAKIQVGLRSDLEFSRQIQEGQPVYVVHDPVSFKTHRFSLADYNAASMLDSNRKLGDVFKELVQQGQLETADRLDFFRFVVQLNRLSLLTLPAQNGKRLFEQYTAETKRKRRSRWIRFLFISIPLINPDRFLDRTMPCLRFLFSRPFFAVWLVAMLATFGLVAARFNEFVRPLSDILAVNNLLFLWCALIILKIWHELGHGYACKVFGGKVPEMGTLLLAGTPAAYMDATAAWSFDQRRQRLIVMLGGMYFESLVAIAAVYVWAFSNSPTLSSYAHYVVVLSSATTILFNANPLMRFDGYFILSDLVGIQNLRSRSIRYVCNWLKLIFLGLRLQSEKRASAKLRSFLFCFGIAAVTYKTTLVFLIAFTIAGKFPVMGFAIATFYTVTTVVGLVIKLAKYLLRSEETKPIRHRSRALAVGIVVGVPALLIVVPVPFSITANGVLGAVEESRIRSETAGVIDKIHVKHRQKVAAGESLVQLKNHDVAAGLATTEAQLTQSQTLLRTLAQMDVVQAAQLQKSTQALAHDHAEKQRRVANLTIAAPHAGVVQQAPSIRSMGKFVPVGEQLALLLNGDSVVRVWLTEEQLDRIVAKPDQRVELRICSHAYESCFGQIRDIHPASKERLDQAVVTQLGGGEIVVDPETLRPMQPTFEVEILLDQKWKRLWSDSYGARARVRFSRKSESLGRWLIRKCLRFFQTTMLT